jgi:hypothetical protein
MSARIVDEACVTLPLLGTSSAEDDIVGSAEMAGLLREAMTRFVAAIGSPREP